MEPLEPHLAAWLDEFTAGADLARGDPRQAHANALQRLGLVTVRLVTHDSTWRASVRITDKGYAALGRTPRQN